MHPLSQADNSLNSVVNLPDGILTLLCFLVVVIGLEVKIKSFRHFHKYPGRVYYDLAARVQQ